jgi:hypothetical protein
MRMFQPLASIQSSVLAHLTSKNVFLSSSHVIVCVESSAMNGPNFLLLSVANADWQCLLYGSM